MSDTTCLSAISMAEQIREKKLLTVELVEAYLAQIEKLNPKLNPLVQVDRDGALLQARSADEAVSRKLRLGPLHGVAVSTKSSIDVEGLRCEAGSRLRAGVVAASSAPLCYPGFTYCVAEDLC